LNYLKEFQNELDEPESDSTVANVAYYDGEAKETDTTLLLAIDTAQFASPACEDNSCGESISSRPDSAFEEDSEVKEKEKRKTHSSLYQMIVTPPQELEFESVAENAFPELGLCVDGGTSPFDYAISEVEEEDRRKSSPSFFDYLFEEFNIEEFTTNELHPNIPALEPYSRLVPEKTPRNFVNHSTGGCQIC
jgi:hypothetical protein